MKKEKSIKKSCGNCKYADTYFGDCCHPKGGGCKNLHPSVNNCLRKNFAWWQHEKT